jgi:fatty-acyl-CoA synthase
VVPELVSVLNKVDCKGIVMASDETTGGTFQEAVPDFDRESSQTIPSLKHIILIGSNKTNIQGAHSYDDLIKHGEAKKTQQQDELDKHQASVDPDSPLAIILTSGSTGEPHPVILTNFAVLNILISHLDYFGSSFIRPCGPQPMHHISGGIWTILIVAINKCTVVIPSLKFNATSAMRHIHQEKCTGLLAPPILFRHILADPNRPKYDLSSLKCVGLGAAHVQPTLLRQIEIEFRIDRVGLAYGLTESGCLLTTSLHCNDERRYTSIGQCMPHMELRLVDNNGRTVPVGSQGEIWARGYSIMRGYYKDPEGTAETMTDAGWLKTGDLATMDQDGYFYFVERKKHLITTQAGENVSPSEVEHAIEEHESVSEAQVFTISDPRVEGIICAFVKLKSGMQCEVDDLKSFLDNKLTAHKIPEHIRFVDEFTRTSLGKVAKYKLAEEMIKTLNL